MSFLTDLKEAYNHTVENVAEVDATLVKEGSKIHWDIIKKPKEETSATPKVVPTTQIAQPAEKTDEKLFETNTQVPKINLPVSEAPAPQLATIEDNLLSLPQEKIALKKGESITDLVQHSQMEQKLEKAGLDKETAIRLTTEVLVLENTHSKSNQLNFPKFSDKAIEIMAIHAKTQQSEPYHSMEQEQELQHNIKPLTTPKKDKAVIETGLAAMGKF